MKKKYKTCFFLLCFTIVFCTFVFAQPVSQTFNVSGTYTVPTGYSANVLIEAWGGGGGGGANTSGAKGGGGGGAYASVTTTLTAGSYTVTIGAGGGAATNGGNSSFTSIVVAAGGSAASGTTGGAGGTTAASTGTTRFAGGSGANASDRDGGGGGGSATSSANGGNASGTTGGTGQGNGGAGGPGNNGDGLAGIVPGGGGGGKAGPGNASNSGSGANGRVIVTVITVVPIKLTNFKAFEKQTGVQLEWTVSLEQNLSRYFVERSLNGIVFTTIGDMAPRNLTVESKYSFFDPIALTGVSFYRLKSMDIDGKFGYSSIVRVSLDKQVKNISLHPNPVNGDFVSLKSANLNKGNYQVSVFKSSGVLVFNQRFSHSGGAINQILNLPVGIQSGYYLLQLSKDGITLLNKIFMIQ